METSGIKKYAIVDWKGVTIFKLFNIHAGEDVGKDRGYTTTIEDVIVTMAQNKVMFHFY